MAVTVLSGTSGALYYKPAGTTGTFSPTDVTIGTETMVVKSYLNLKAGDPVKFKVVDSSSGCLLYTSPSPRDRQKSRMPSSA